MYRKIISILEFIVNNFHVRFFLLNVSRKEKEVDFSYR